MAVFFFLSGYGLVVSLIMKGQKYLDGFLKKRLLKIVLPLVLCSIVFGATSITLWGGKLLISERTGLFCPTVGFVYNHNLLFCVPYYSLAFQVFSNKSSI